MGKITPRMIRDGSEPLIFDGRAIDDTDKEGLIEVIRTMAAEAYELKLAIEALPSFGAD